MHTISPSEMSGTYYIPKVDSFVVPELTAAHVTVVTNDLPYMFRRHILFHRINEAKFPLFGITL